MCYMLRPDLLGEWDGFSQEFNSVRMNVFQILRLKITLKKQYTQTPGPPNLQKPKAIKDQVEYIYEKTIRKQLNNVRGRKHQMTQKKSNKAQNCL